MKRYGIWNNMKKEFQFGIDEPTPRKAENKLFKKIGYDSYKWRFEVKEIKEDKRKDDFNMSIIAKSTGEAIERLEDGVYTAICVGLVDVGEQYSEMYGKSSRQVRIIWQICGETYKNAEGEDVPRSYSKQYTLSLGDRSKLRKDLEAWRGKPFTEEELGGFDLMNILNKPCQLQLMNKSKNEKTYTDIVAIMALPKGMVVEPLQSTYIFDFEDELTYPNYLMLPEWMRKFIKSATNFTGSALEIWVKNNELDLEADASEIPVNTEEAPF